jgi:hypothetical protein
VGAYNSTYSHFKRKYSSYFSDHDYTTVLKSRQLGISTLAAGYGLWLMTFHKDKNILALATTQATARNLVTKVQFLCGKTYHHGLK